MVGGVIHPILATVITDGQLNLCVDILHKKEVGN